MERKNSIRRKKKGWACKNGNDEKDKTI